MPIATPEVYAQMLDTAKEQGFAFPAINVTSTQTLNAALKGFSDAGSDGIVQISTGGAEYLSGQAVKDMVTGAVALAEFAHVVAAKYPIHVALHTDHCPKDKLDTYMRPLVAISRERVDGLLEVLGRGVELLVDLGLDTVLFTADDADLDLEDDLGGRGLLEQLLGDLQVLVDRHRGAVPHVRLEQRVLAGGHPLGRDGQ